MSDLVKGGIIPACIAYQSELAKLLGQKKACGEFDLSLEEHLLGRSATLSVGLRKALNSLENVLAQAKEDWEILAQARFYRERVFAAMSELRRIADELEALVAKKHWPLPAYAELLYSVV
jgi:glutamine synthetase